MVVRSAPGSRENTARTSGPASFRATLESRSAMGARRPWSLGFRRPCVGGSPRSASSRFRYEAAPAEGIASGFRYEAAPRKASRADFGRKRLPGRRHEPISVRSGSQEGTAYRFRCEAAPRKAPRADFGTKRLPGRHRVPISVGSGFQEGIASGIRCDCSQGVRLGSGRWHGLRGAHRPEHREGHRRRAV
ncbi:Hypothetical protein A7982_04890 [Minicystis rosea]|nr:Hypothetical protein A7982_04890 [Minicystis rosea]